MPLWGFGTLKSFKLQRHLRSPGIFQIFKCHVYTAASANVSQSTLVLNLSIFEYENNPFPKRFPSLSRKWWDTEVKGGIQMCGFLLYALFSSEQNNLF